MNENENDKTDNNKENNEEPVYELPEMFKLPSRSSRGNRMSALVNDEIEKDEADEEFWNQAFFTEEPEDVDNGYTTESESEDVADSDFDKSEHSSDHEEIQEEAEKETKKRKNVYVDPAKVKKKQKISETEAVKIVNTEVQQRPQSPNILEKKKKSEEATTPTLRKSTRELSDAKKAERVEYEAEMDRRKKLRQKKPKTIEKILTQEEILEEAINVTEKVNAESLRFLLQLEEEKKKPPPPKPKFQGPMIVSHSKQGVDTVTFTKVRNLPRCLVQPPKDPPGSLICPISGKPAKYKDPKTGIAYATKEAFKMIREKYIQAEEQECNLRVEELTKLLNEKEKQKQELHQQNREIEELNKAPNKPEINPEPMVT